MRKSTKGAFAAGTAAVLLLGGVGTLAFWTDDEDAPGATIDSGHLSLGTANCVGWQLDGGAAYSTQLLVPGDTLTQVCSFTVDTEGEHLAASFDVSTATFTGDQALLDELDLSATYEVNDVASTPPAVIVDGDVVEATIVVTWPYGTVDNDSNVLTGLQAILSAITVTATQTHDAA
jgi:alternate signal-mediated exported protein